MTHPDHLPRRYEPSPVEVEDLIRRAADHDLGTDFLREGALDSVSAIFGVHAFVVDAARARLAADPPAVHVLAAAARAPA
ncbi:MAG: hypothetical protein ACYTG1_08275 [Planctomycetota bacterium]|jgi:hypothetical protein